MTSGHNFPTNSRTPYPWNYLMLQQIAAVEGASVPLEDKMEAVRCILASMTDEQDGLNLGNHQEEPSPQGPPTTSS